MLKKVDVSSVDGEGNKMTRNVPEVTDLNLQLVHVLRNGLLLGNLACSRFTNSSVTLFEQREGKGHAPLRVNFDFSESRSRYLLTTRFFFPGLPFNSISIQVSSVESFLQY